MRNFPFAALAAILALWMTIPAASAQSGPPRDNPYDVIGRVFQPFWGVLLAETKSPNKASILRLRMTEVSGRLPKEMEGASLDAAVQFPDKVKLTAPVMGEEVIVCRVGDEVWAVPGAKVEFLLKQFDVKPAPKRKKNTPLYLPITAQQAFFLPAIFSVKQADVAEMGTIDGQEYRVVTAGLMPELAKSVDAEEFEASMWVGPGYVPRRFEIQQPDFTAVVDVLELKFSPSLPASTWMPPEGVTDIYRTHADMLDAVLFVVMNSLELESSADTGLNIR